MPAFFLRSRHNNSVFPHIYRRFILRWSRLCTNLSTYPLKNVCKHRGSKRGVECRRFANEDKFFTSGLWIMWTMWVKISPFSRGRVENGENHAVLGDENRLYRVN